MLTYSTKRIGLIGRVWDDGRESLKTLVIEKGRITQMMDGKGDLTGMPDITVIELEEETVIFPGLINLHTHIGYNILPIWESRTIWKNRFQWRNNAGYKKAISGLLDYIKGKWQEDGEIVATLAVAAGAGAAGTTDAEQAAAQIAKTLPEVEKAHVIISEIQAVAGGTTIIQQTLDLDDEQPDNRSFIIRNTGDQLDLPIPANKQVNSVVDFYKPNVTPNGTAEEDTGSWMPVVQSTYTDFVRSVNNDNTPYYSSLIHAGEGKAGFVKGSVADPYSRKEMDLLFASLKKDIPDPGRLRQARLAITHGCGIDLTGEGLEIIRRNGLHWIWSPVSNLLLYRDTVDVRRLLEKDITVCLGSDWSPSGSKHVLDELKFARFVTTLLDLRISDRELFKMVTDNPAAVLGLSRSGSVKEGGDADLFVLRKQRKEEDALQVLLESSDKDIDFVMVNGRIVFGLTRYFKDQLKVDYQGFSAQEGMEVSERGVSINSVLHFDLAGALHIMDTLLQRYGATVLQDPGLRRTKFMAADDVLYQKNIEGLRDQVAQLCWG
jgi:5-methylthioadenosine/S-adenosylhomocysteine deaminase